MEILSLKTMDALDKLLHAIPRFVLQVFLATVCAVLLGSIFYLPLSPVLDRFSSKDSDASNIIPFLFAAASAAIIAFLYQWKTKVHVSCWVWIPPLLWLALLAYQDYTSVTHQVVPWYAGTATKYLWYNYAGSGCSATECIGKLIGTIPFLTSVVYSIAAYFLDRRVSTRGQSSQALS